MNILLLLALVAAMSTEALQWSDVCIKATNTCYFHPLNDPPFNNLANYIGAAAKPIVTDYWTVKINPYQQSCDPSNCSNLAGVNPTHGLFSYTFGHLTIPFSQFTITSMVDGIPIHNVVDTNFYTNNRRNTPECGVMTIIGTDVTISGMHFVYEDECAVETVPHKNRVPIQFISPITRSAFVRNITCTDCFAPVAMIAGNTLSNVVTSTIDTTGTLVENVGATSVQPRFGKKLAFVCGACVGGMRFSISNDQMVWWTSSMIPDGNPDIFNASDVYQNRIQLPAVATMQSCGASQTSINTMITVLVMFILVVLIFIVLTVILNSVRHKREEKEK